MQRIDRDHFPTRPAVVTIGNFDGVHIGHQALLSVALREAKERGGDMVVMTFAPHPMSVLRPESPVYLITPIDLKLYYLGLSGVKWVDILPFSQDIAIIPPLAFWNYTWCNGFMLKPLLSDTTLLLVPEDSETRRLLKSGAGLGRWRFTWWSR